jgi:hypothetical protein
MQFRNLDITDDEKENLVKVCLLLLIFSFSSIAKEEGMELCQVTAMT